MAIPQSGCVKNLTSECLCTDVALNVAVGVCAQKTCTVYELLQTKNVSSRGCGVPVRDRGRDFVVIGLCGVVVAMLAFVMRLGASLLKNGRQMSWDDATMGIVVALSIPPAVFAFFLVDNGLGRDMWTLKDYQITNVLRFYYFGEIFYVVALGISKISILFFYLRVFPEKGFRRLIYGIMGLSAAYTIAFFLATLLQCMPISYAWTQWDGLHEGKCNNIHLQGWIAAGINIMLDGIVMVLPLKHLAGLNMNLRRKLMVMAMFSVGIIVIVISSLRLYTLAHFANSKNITWDYFEAGYWSLLEIDVSIICGCMPAHRLLLSRLWPKVKLTFNSGKNTSTSSSALSGGVRSNAMDKKIARISIKPKIGDAGDFIPLVSMDSGNVHHSTTNDMRLERSAGDNHLDNWPIANGKVEKEYV
ncbi:CFEM domain-containing protein [Didymella exigua CBS 183.55]|uniref:CFEM domain-containing protein n=1 Tax=Didymella exigua CBS 183.55 TaxID=1150837 RepID=A0A6A5S2R3_9PLEO|nr:CFEM domain-containing protein [Didymella exigua CBS 183.55]KAF1933714.1 CFEM domain-containing protein [Didymella exigua CBS 183.55]